MGTKPAALMKHKQKACSCFFSFLVLFLLLTRSSHSLTRNWRNISPISSSREGPSARGLKASHAQRKCNTCPYYRRDSKAENTTPRLSQDYEDTKLSHCKSTSKIRSFHVFGTAGIYNPELEPKYSSANAVKRILKSCHYLTEAFVKYSG